MNPLNRFCAWLVLFAFGLPSAAGTGLHGLLPEHCFHHTDYKTDHTEQAPGETDLSYSGAPSDTCSGAEETTADHSDDCFLCRFFTRQNSEITLIALPILIQRLGRAVERHAVFESEAVPVLHAGRSPPVYSLAA